MYKEFFHLRQAPFSIAPDPRYLFMSRRHREALAHLLYGAEGGGGFVLLTGEIGAGKTTVCRCLLEQVPDDCRVAYIFNPKLSAVELLQSICHEFSIQIALHPTNQPPGIATTPGVATPGVKTYVDALNAFLLAEHAQGRNTVLIIDEAQNLSLDVLEQLRLLTNLETSSRKLLQIILIGQPELRAMLARPELEQLAQRTIARYHLDALSEAETAEYVAHRLSVAGLSGATPFRPAAMKLIHRLTRGIPRRINLLCDRCLLGAYAGNSLVVDRRIVHQAAIEIFGPSSATRTSATRLRTLARWGVALGVSCGVAVGTLAASTYWQTRSAAPAAPRVEIPEHSTLVDLNDAFDAMPEDEASAYRQLMQFWGLSVALQDPCTVAQGSGLQCYAGVGGFAELQSLDRPAVLKLRDPDGKPRFALLTALSPRVATLRVGDATYSVHPSALARHFRGIFATVWAAPHGFNGKIGLGDRGLAVDWLATALAAHGGAEARAAGRPFDAALDSRLKDFQIAQGLKPDGVAGPKTMMLLNRAAGVDEPRLQKQSIAAYGK